ncbi:hypothetical protein ACHAWF_014278 [Thalassiosira exigua]
MSSEAEADPGGDDADPVLGPDRGGATNAVAADADREFSEALASVVARTRNLLGKQHNLSPLSSDDEGKEGGHGPNVDFDEDDEDVDENEPLEVDYDSDDDSDDGDGGMVVDEGLRDTARLSRRTNDLMADFRDYVTEMGGGTGASTGGPGSAGDGGDVERGRGRSRDEPELPVHRGEVDWAKSGLLRDFAVKDFEEGGAYDGLDGSHRDGARDEARGGIRSKRVQRGLGMVALVALSTGIAIRAVQLRRRAHLPDWTGELNEMMAEEEREHDREHNAHVHADGSIAAVPSEPLQKHPEVPFDQTTHPQQQGQHYPQGEKFGSSSSSTAADAILSEALAAPSSPSHLAVAARYDPLWYDRSAGYDAATYEGALLFCARKGLRIPCPYEAYCPDGPGTAPFGGYKNEPLGSWAAVVDDENGWVQVSEGKVGHEYGDLEKREGGGCMMHNFLHDASPEWGENGENEEQTRHVLCCLSSTDEDAGSILVQGGEEASQGDEEPPSSSSSSSSMSSMSGAAATSDEPGASPEESPGSLPLLPGQFVDVPVDEEVAAAEYDEAAAYDPTWHGRDDGWDGQTYDDARRFCEGMAGSSGAATGKRGLCHYEVVCPTGPHHIPYGGAVEEASSWTPTSDSYYSWIQIGDPGTLCMSYMNLNLAPPLWEDNDELTHVLCCTDLTTSNAVDTTPETLVPEETAFTEYVPEEILTEEDLVELYKPVWYDSNSGWEGSTFLEAIQFCSSKGPMHQLCNFEMYCPGGEGFTPYGGVVGATDSWAPMTDGMGNWVQLGPFKTCTYQLKGADEEVSTGYVMCCRKTDVDAQVGADETGATLLGSTETPQPSKALTSSPTPPPTRLPTSPPTRPPTPLPTTSDPTIPPSPQDPYMLAKEKYEPIWFDRSSGWTGRTYEQSLNFCATQENTLGETMMLCPYAAYCPEGAGNKPSGDYREDISWAPIINKHNEWVATGVESACLLYTSIYPDSPAWGITGEANEGLTKAVMCCSKQHSLDVGEANDIAGLQQEQLDSYAENMQQSVHVEALELDWIYNQIDSSFKPVGFDRFRGWQGSTYSEAFEYCKLNAGTAPCPFEALCPNDIGGMPTAADGIWMPLGDDNNWVELREGGYCGRHTVLPSHEDVTRHVLCCSRGSTATAAPHPTPSPHGNIPFAITSPGSAMSPTIAFSAADIQTNKPTMPPAPSPSVQLAWALAPAEELDHVFQSSIERFHTVGYGRDQGWSGSTYGETLQFCASKNSKVFVSCYLQRIFYLC